jgi:hypothetical protein
MLAWRPTNWASVAARSAGGSRKKRIFERSWCVARTRSVEALEAEHRALDEEMERYWADRQAHEMLK